MKCEKRAGNELIEPGDQSSFSDAHTFVSAIKIALILCLAFMYLDAQSYSVAASLKASTMT